MYKGYNSTFSHFTTTGKQGGDGGGDDDGLGLK
jgi:hypothetical protein